MTILLYHSRLVQNNYFMNEMVTKNTTTKPSFHSGQERNDIFMKNPNGYGSITKLPGNRRKPFRVRKTDGWEMYDRLNKCYLKKIPSDCNPFEKLNDGKLRFQSKQKYINIGYYATRQEAMIALADYNKDPFDLNLASITFSEVYDKWSEIHFETVSASNVQGYKAAYKLCGKLEKMRMVDIKLDHLQRCVDESGKNTPTLRKVKVLWGLMYDYCVMHEILTQEKRDMVRYVDISKAGNPNAYDRKPFTKKEIKTVWKWKDTNEYIRVILMLIYSGCRISELLDLKKVNVNLKEKWFDITASKTEAGIRKVPISDKVLPYFHEWMNMNDCEYLISTSDAKHFEYRNYYDSYWTPFIEQMGMEHTPHCTRHTCISMLAEAGVDDRMVKKIVGHKGQGVTQTVYTHFEIDALLESINKI